MEMFGLIVGLLVAVWFLGFMRTVRTLADAANDQVTVLGIKAQENKQAAAKRLGEMSEEDIAKARKGLALYEEFKL